MEYKNKREVWRKYADNYIQTFIANHSKGGQRYPDVDAETAARYADKMLAAEEKRFGKIDD
jgi:hypothetical protein